MTSRAETQVSGAGRRSELVPRPPKSPGKLQASLEPVGQHWAVTPGDVVFIRENDMRDVSPLQVQKLGIARSEGLPIVFPLQPLELLIRELGLRDAVLAGRD